MNMLGWASNNPCFGVQLRPLEDVQKEAKLIHKNLKYLDVCKLTDQPVLFDNELFISQRIYLVIGDFASISSDWNITFLLLAT